MRVTKIILSWLPNWKAYMVVDQDHRSLGMVRFSGRLPFRVMAEFA